MEWDFFAKFVMPDVSVIIPCYNHGHYLPYALQSVLAQAYTRWEAIVVDDGSTDETAGVAANFTDPRIRYVYQENKGLSTARNTGIRVARGEYLAFLDADDEWEPEFLALCVNILQQQDTLGFVYTRNRFMDRDGSILPMLGGQVVTSNHFRERLLEGGFFPPNSVVLKGQALTTVGDFDTNLTSVEDWDLWLRISLYYPVCGIEEPLARYRVYPGSMSTNAGRMHDNRVAVLIKHFGPPEGDPVTWPDEKRLGYAFAYRTTALGYIAQQEPDEGWRFLRQAIETDPIILERLDTFYELALGDQPRGYRGVAELVDIERNGAVMLQRLNNLIASADTPAQMMRNSALGNAYLALAMLHDQADDWPAARRYMRKAVKSSPSLLRSAAHRRRLLKLHAGQRLIQVLRPARGFINGAAS